MHAPRIRSWSVPPLVALLVIAAVLIGGRTVAAADAGRYQQTNLVSDQAGMAPVVDPDLLNPWGLVAGPATPWWVSDNNAGVSTLYTGAGAKVPRTFTVPPPAGAPAGTQSTPTGIVFNGNAAEFPVPGTGTGSVFIFDTEDGTLSAWNPTAGSNAVLTVDNSTSGAVYKGLALAPSSAGDRLYATDLHNGKVDVFDSNFAPVTLPAGAFTDPAIPTGFAPFGLENIGGMLFVTYAKPDAARQDEVAGVGLGFIDVFTPDGTLVQRFARHGLLNAPWGMAVAPAGFGQFGGDLLVGNFGDGRINAFNPTTGELLGPVRSSQGQRLAIDGLWGLAFGNGGAAGPADTLYFTAGPNDQADGLFGTLTPATG